MDGFKEQVAKALRILDELEKGGDVTTDTSAADRRRKEQRAEGKPTRYGNTAGRAHKIKYNGDKTLVYAIANGGAIVITPGYDGRLTKADYRAMLQAVLGHMKGEQEMEKSAKKVPMLLKRKGTSPPKPVTHRQQPVQQPPRVAAKAPEQPQPPAQVSQTQLAPPARERNPLVDRFSLIQGQVDLRNLSGHQMAAIKAGLDPNTPGIEKMDVQQMKSLAAQQVVESVKDLQERVGIAYIRDPRPWRF